MQESNIVPHTYQNQFFYIPSSLYVAPPPISYPVYFIDFNTMLNYQISSQNFETRPFWHLQNTPQPTHPISNQLPPTSVEKQINSTTSNSSYSSNHISQIQKKRTSGKTQISIRMNKRSPKESVVRGNDRFIKKNTQSNVVNQVFSFLWTPEKSKLFLIKTLKDESNLQVFYHFMNLVKVHCKSQLNRYYLKQLMLSSEWQSGFTKLKKKTKKYEDINSQEICTAIKKLTFVYLTEISRCSIMTSKKMNRQLWKLHFEKCRQLIGFLFDETHV